MCGAKIGLCLPRRMRATSVHSRPSTRPSASTTCHARWISLAFGVYVAMPQSASIRWVGRGKDGRAACSREPCNDTGRDRRRQRRAHTPQRGGLGTPTVNWVTPGRRGGAALLLSIGYPCRIGRISDAGLHPVLRRWSSNSDPASSTRHEKPIAHRGHRRVVSSGTSIRTCHHSMGWAIRSSRSRATGPSSTPTPWRARCSTGIRPT